MYRHFNKKTKEALVGGAITLIIAVVSFTGNSIYDWITHTPKLKISRIVPLGLHHFHLDDTTRYLLRRVLPGDVIKKQALDSMVLNLDKRLWTQDEVDNASEIIASVVVDCQTGIDLCNNTLKDFRRLFILNHPERKNLAFLGYQASSTIIKKPFDSISCILLNYLQEHQYCKDLLERLNNAIHSCSARHCDLWQFKLEVSNLGNVPAYISQDAVVRLNDIAVPYIVANSMKEGVPCTTQVSPRNEKGSVVVWLVPDMHFLSEPENVKITNLLHGRISLSYEVDLKTTEGGFIRQGDSISLQ